MTDCCQNLIKHQCAMHIVHTEAHLFSVPNDCLWYDKLWGPSQRVVTLFYESIMIYVLLSIMGEPEKEDELG